MIYLVDIIDHANFSVKMCSTRAFTQRDAAEAYGVTRREAKRYDRKVNEGELDETFIEAIVYQIDEVELDNGEF